VDDGAGTSLGSKISGIDDNGTGVVGFVGVAGAVGSMIALNGIIGEEVSPLILTADGEKVGKSGSVGFIGDDVDCGSCATLGEGVVMSMMQGASSLSLQRSPET